MTPERIKDDFRITLASLKIRKGWSDADIAKRIGCKTPVTVSRMRSDPFRVNGQFILMVQALAREAEGGMK